MAKLRFSEKKAKASVRMNFFVTLAGVREIVDALAVPRRVCRGRFKAHEPAQTKEPNILPSLKMEPGQRSSPQSINRPHPSPHLCRMTEYGYIHHAVKVSNRA